MGLLKLAFDRQNKTLASYGGSVTSLPPLYQGNTQDIQITIVDSTGSQFRPTITPVDCSASSLRLIIATAVTGETDTILAATYEAGWSWDAVNQCFTGQLNLDTAEINAHLGNSSFRAAILEANLVTSGVKETVYGGKSGATNVVINAIGDDSGSVSPSVLTAPPSIGRLAIQDGVAGVTQVDNVVTVAGLGLGFTPSYYLVSIEAPAASGAMFANFVVGSGTSDGFSAVISAVPSNIANYKLVYIPVP